MTSTTIPTFCPRCGERVEVPVSVVHTRRERGFLRTFVAARDVDHECLPRTP